MTRIGTTRRNLLVGSGALLAGELIGCQDLLRAWLTRHDNSGFERKSFGFEDTDRCLLTAEAIEGPQEPYRQHGPSPFTNRNHGIIHESEGAVGGWLRMSGDTSGYVGSVTLGIPA